MEDILNVKMPPAEPPTELPNGKPNITFEEKEVEAEPDSRAEEPDSRAEYAEQQVEAEEELEKNFIPDEEVFNKPPQVQKVKKKCSEKQLAHLERIRKKALEKKAQQKAFKEEQKAKQKKFVNAERKKKLVKKKAPQAVQQREPIYEEEYAEQQVETDEEELEELEKEEKYYPRRRAEETRRRYDQQPIYHKLTAAEIRAIQKDAISDYEVIRKDRKLQKEINNKQLLEEQKKQEAIRMISANTHPANDPWASAFTFG
jgi:hypothetical protein